MKALLDHSLIRYDDLPRGVQDGEVGSALVLMDIEPDRGKPIIEDWMLLLTGARITIACVDVTLDEYSRFVANFFPDADVAVIGMHDWVGNELSDRDQRMLWETVPAPDLILSGLAYDSFGEHIKRELEASVQLLLQRWPARYGIHDPKHRLIRVADDRMLQDRLVGRHKRLAAYHFLLKCLLRCARLVAGTKNHGWTRVPLI